MKIGCHAVKCVSGEFLPPAAAKMRRFVSLPSMQRNRCSVALFVGSTPGVSRKHTMKRRFGVNPGKLYLTSDPVWTENISGKMVSASLLANLG